MAARWPQAAKILVVALSVRIITVLYHNYVGPLPDSAADAVWFERLAWRWAQGGFVEAFGRFTGPNSYFISWVLALLYSVTDRSVMMAQSVSLLFGMGTVFLGWLLARKLWGGKIASKAGWALALFPTLILYSALILREAYAWLFLLVALHGVVDWAKGGGLRSMALALFGFVGAGFFHGAMLVGALVFVFILIGNSFTRTLKALSCARFDPISFVTLIVAIIGLGSFLSGAVTVPKLGTFEQAMDPKQIIRVIGNYTRESSEIEESARYPSWSVPNSVAELIYKAPIRVTYFTLAPFPWDVRLPRHLIGLIDGVLYAALVFFIWRHRKVIWADRAARAVVLILAGYFLVFGLIVSNFGTGVRHRAKFAAALIVLAAPLLPRIRFLSNLSARSSNEKIR